MLDKKIKEIDKLNSILEEHINSFRDNTGLTCINNCGHCCLKNDLETTVLEFLPAARYLYNKGKSEDILAKIDKANSKICIFYNAQNKKGFCSLYKHRAFICRLFGFSVNYDKNQLPLLITCKKIKETYDKDKVDPFLYTAPVIQSYYLMLSGIDPGLTNITMPINEAIKKALELVSFHYQYKVEQKYV